MNAIDELLRDAGTRMRATAPSAEATDHALDTLGDAPVVALAHRPRQGRRRAWIVAPALLASAAAVSAVIVLNRDGHRSITPATTPTGPTTPAPTVPGTTVSPPAGWSPTEYPNPLRFAGGEGGGNATAREPSPVLTADPSPLTDGTYRFEIVGWSPNDPTTLRVTLRSIVRCADGVDGCTPGSDGTYGPDDVGTSANSRELTIRLDESVVVYLGGDDTSADFSEGLRSVVARSDGRGLAELMSAIATAYDSDIAARLLAGESADTIVDDLIAAPRDGFSSARDAFTGDLYFQHGDAPAVLYQGIADQGAALPRSGTSALLPRTLTISDGSITLELYAGFLS